MKLLDRYLLGQFLRNLSLVLASLVAIYLLVDFFERIDNFLSHQIAFGSILQYFVLKIPLIIEQILPVCILLAGVVTLGLLNHSREMVALKAGGISVLRVIKPLVWGSVLITLLALAASQWVLPPALSVTNRIWYEDVKELVPRGIYRNGRTYYRGEDGIYSFSQPNPRENHFTDFSYLVWGKEYSLGKLLSSQTADWHQGRWIFRNGQIKTSEGSGSYKVRLFDEMILDLPATPADFFMPEYKKAEQSLSQLFSEARQDHFQKDGEAWLKFNQRLSYLFLGLPLLLIGIPVLLVVHQKWGRDLTLAIPISCGLAFAAWGWWSAMESLATSAYLNPVLASWSIHLLVGSAGIVAMARQNR